MPSIAEPGGRRMRAGPAHHPTVHVVDDDAQVRRAVWFLLESAGYAPRVFACGDDLLAELDELPLAPVLVDLCPPGFAGFDLLDQVRQRTPTVPVVVMSGHGDVACAVRAMKSGAIDFIEKPFADDTLLTAVATATGVLARTLAQGEAQRDATRRIAALSAREKEVLASLAAGKSNKVIAFDLALSIRTVEMHRVRMMRHLAARTLAEALRLAHLAGLDMAITRRERAGG
ncbi:response regulator transcription factor [Sphingomonas sp.]|uniref:response regulator transcription factor n=1 Tax=Sphingomonas sp. TaxID=28214 RepID=UPI002BA1B407|nr:response regulator [Sphingomonas sp.]HWK36507.1 response regulator [Sphingomonas sp.]